MNRKIAKLIIDDTYNTYLSEESIENLITCLNFLFQPQGIYFSLRIEEDDLPHNMCEKEFKLADKYLKGDS